MPDLPPYKYTPGEIPEQLSRWLELARRCILTAPAGNVDSGNIGDACYVTRLEDLPRNNSAVSVADPQLTKALIPESLYALEGAVRFTNVGTGIRFRISGPAEGFYHWATTNPATLVTTEGNAAFDTDVTIPTVDVGMDQVVEISGMVRTAITETFTFSWGQETSSATFLVCDQGSWFRLTRTSAIENPIPIPEIADPANSPTGKLMAASGRIATWINFGTKQTEFEPRWTRDIGTTRHDLIRMGPLAGYLFDQDGPGDPGIRSTTVLYADEAANAECGFLLPRRTWTSADNTLFGTVGMMSMWIFPFGNITQEIPLWYVQRYHSSSNPATGAFWRIEADGSIMSFVSIPNGASPSGQRQTDDNGLITPNAWNWLAWRMEGAGNWEFWVNGVEQASSNVGANTDTNDWIRNWEWGQSSNTKDVVSIGASFGGNSGNNFSSEQHIPVPNINIGYADYITYDRNMPTDANMLAIYNQGITP